MCGIFGYYTYNVKTKLHDSLATLLNGLHRLEYRGYDSAGLAVDLVDAQRFADAGDNYLPEENGDLADTPFLSSSTGFIFVRGR